MIRTAVGWFGVALLLAAIALGFMAYFVVDVDAGTGISRDGLGRRLYPAPFLIQLTQLDEWAGLAWWAVDMVVFWATFVTGIYLAGYGFAEERTP